MTDIQQPKDNKNNEEVDLIVFFNLIGTAINKVFTAVASVFIAFFSAFIYGLKMVLKHWKIVLTLICIAAGIGYTLDRNKPIHYQSEMLVEPYFNSKHQLVSTIKYFNTLIATQDHEALSAIFNSDSTPKVDVSSLKGFTIEPGPETEIDRLLQYKTFASEQDTLILKELDYKKFIASRNIYTSKLFIITAVANTPDIFSGLNHGISTSFSNEYGKTIQKREVNLYKTNKQSLETSLLKIDSMQAIYLKLLEKNAEQAISSLNLSGVLVGQENKTTTREYDLFNKELQLRRQLVDLEAQKPFENVFVDVVSSFQAVGEKRVVFRENYTLVFPVLAFLLLALIYGLIRLVNFVKNYEN